MVKKNAFFTLKYAEFGITVNCYMCARIMGKARWINVIQNDSLLVCEEPSTDTMLYIL